MLFQFDVLADDFLFLGGLVDLEWVVVIEFRPFLFVVGEVDPWSRRFEVVLTLLIDAEGVIFVGGHIVAIILQL